ncbi:MAG TPA: nucleotidyltransferase domain-containing protein [Dongiaceae bacterium]|nr:nucleotidyltransferase domain-containing protein [Dongiaceae bacterium]
MKPAAQSFFRYPLDRVFENPANVRVLRAAVLHGDFMTSGAIMQQAKITRMSVLSALRRLAEAGLVEAVGSARQRLYRVNRLSPFAAPLDALFQAEGARYSETMAAIRNAAERLGAEAVWIYGSVARGRDRPESDIDIAVACPKGKETKIGAVLRDRLSRLGDTPSLTLLEAPDIARLERESDPWWRAVKRDAVTVLGPGPEQYADKLRRKAHDPERKPKDGRH